ncbi:hypothetical protein [Qipengyuania sp. SM2507]
MRYKGRSTIPPPLREGFVPHDGSGRPEGLEDDIRVQLRSGSVTILKGRWTEDPWIWNAARPGLMNVVGYDDMVEVPRLDMAKPVDG